jgi:hypothetical protein
LGRKARNSHTGPANDPVRRRFRDQPPDHRCGIRKHEFFRSASDCNPLERMFTQPFHHQAVWPTSSYAAFARPRCAPVCRTIPGFLGETAVAPAGKNPAANRSGSATGLPPTLAPMQLRPLSGGALGSDRFGQRLEPAATARPPKETRSEPDRLLCSMTWVCRSPLYSTGAAGRPTRCNARWQCGPFATRSSTFPLGASGFACAHGRDAVIPCEKLARCNLQCSRAPGQLPGHGVMAFSRPLETTG